MKNGLLLLFGAFILVHFVFSTTLLLNSQEYSDIISGAAYAKYNNYSYVFSLTPNQSVFVSKYYTLDPSEQIIYLEGKKPVLPNMKALLLDSGIKKLEAYAPDSIQSWVADRLPKNLAIIVGRQYGQDALSVSSYAALRGAPIFFIDPAADYSKTVEGVASRGYSQVLIYGPIASQIGEEQLALLPNRRVIDTGSRYSNNVEIVSDFLSIRPSEQAMFVSGRTFEKSMVDANYPIVLVGRSDVPAQLSEFISNSTIKTGIVFSGDGDIVEGVNKLREQSPDVSFFVKFGEGYRGSTQPLPLVIIPLPAPTISLQVINLTYNVPSKLFELRIKNTGDFAAVGAGATVPGAGSTQSSQVLMDPNSITTISIPLDASSAIVGGTIPSVAVTISYGEDTQLMDNIDSITFSSVGTSFYNDTSSVELSGIAYSSQEKAFILTFEGHGWVAGTLGFNINNRPIILRIPLTSVDKITVVKIKHLLSADEEKFISGLEANYFVRMGQKGDILIKELRGQGKIQLLEYSPKGNFSLQIDQIYIFAIVILIVGAILAFKFFGGDGGSSFS
ncbi:MAG: cell wall-binding repeat-containing protein [Candidatus Micrarchaeota archaeon]